MTLLLRQLFQFLKLLNSDTGTNQLSAGIACGFILGMTPAFSLQTLLVFVFAFFFRVQLGAVFIMALFFKFPAYLLDPLFHEVGVMVLEAEGLRPFLTELYAMPIIPFTRFNNSIVMGAGVVCIALSPIVFVLSNILIKKYREKIVNRFQSTKAWKLMTATGFYKWYVKYDQLFG